MIQLYLNNEQVDIGEQFSLTEVYQLDKFSNPTTELDNHSYSITLPNTMRNKQVLGNIGNEMWADGGVDGKSKIDFRLLSDGVLVEEGYAQLSQVTTTNGKKNYSLILYGGLGDFLYNLQVNDSGEKIKMSDILPKYPFTINANFIRDCWNTTDYTGYEAKNWLSFAPCYNGFPDNFDADKVMVNIAPQSANRFPRTLTVDGATYSPYTDPSDSSKKWGMMKLNRKVNEWEVRELRSYLQRPVIKLSRVIDRILDYSSYSVEKGAFFTKDNPYWNDTWIALPLLNSDLSSKKSSETITLNNGQFKITPSDYNDGTFYDEFYLGDVDMSNMSYDVAQTFNVNVDARLLPTQDGSSKALTQDIYYMGFEGEITTGRGKKKQKKTIYWGNKFRFRLKFTDKNGNIKGYSDWSTEQNGNYKKDSSGNYWLDKSLSFIVEGKYWSSTLKVYLEAEMILSRQSPVLSFLPEKTTALSNVLNGIKNDIEITVEANAKFEYGANVKSGSSLKLNELWKDSATPAEVLLNYCKMFGILMVKDPIKRKIKLLTRDEFYTNDVVELIVDESKSKTLTPYIYNTAFQSFGGEQPSDTFGERYKEKYDKVYGKYDVYTGYEFNKTSTDLVKDSCFKNCISGKGTSNYYRNFRYNGERIMPYMVDSHSLTYYRTENNKRKEGTEDNRIFRPFTFVPWSNVDGSDFVDKLGFDLDGKQKYSGLTLCFFNGWKNYSDVEGLDIYYTLTDDNEAMLDLNDNKGCWIYDSSVGHRYSLPYFSRYYITYNSDVRRSLDYGLPEEAYSEFSYSDRATIYNQYWKNYYDWTVGSQKLSCYAMLSPLTDNTCLTKRYYYNGQYWRMNRAEIDKAGTGLSKVELIRVL